MRRQHGFTLVEAIIVIAIIGIVGAIVAVFIRLPVQNYADSVARAEITDEADLVLRRMARELRLALPNSIRVNSDGSAIEFLLTKTGGRYLALEDNLASTYPILDFSTASNRTVTVLGSVAAKISAGDYFVVYNLGSGMAPADAYGFTTSDRNIARIGSIASSVLTLADNPFASQSVSLPSPDRRFQIVSGPVTYACAPASASDATLVLTRYAGYAINANQVNPPTGATSVAPITRRASSCAGLFNYDTAAQRSALVSITLELAARTTAGTAATSTIRLVDQVHVDNTP
jgi:MSHA biogenesis protein MshO